MPDDSDRKPSRRLQTATERELESERARRERSPIPGTPYEIDFEEITGRYEGEELETMRERRPTPDRIRRLEKKHDELADDIKGVAGDVKDLGHRLGTVEVAVADVGGQMKILPELVETMQNATTALQQRDHVTFTAKVDVDKAKAIADTQVQKAEALDLISVRKAKRIRATKILGSVVGAITSGAVLHWLLGML